MEARGGFRGFVPALVALVSLLAATWPSASSFCMPPGGLPTRRGSSSSSSSRGLRHSPWSPPSSSLLSLSSSATDGVEAEELEDDMDDRIITVSAKAMDHIRMLREKQKDQWESEIVLRMGVKSGGCSGLSYVMDLDSVENVTEDDMVEDFGEGNDRVRCVIDPKSVLYLYGMTLDYSDELIGGGFQFQ